MGPRQVTYSRVKHHRLARLAGAACVVGLAWAQAARGDQFHYNNVLVGTRAVGMGGAFGAVADDASGIYYNPGGLAFALSNDIQGSANAFYDKQTTYKKTLGNIDFKETSSGSLTPFFGGLQKLDRYVDGLTIAFGVYYIDGDLKDQDSVIENQVLGSTTIDRYHRTSNARAGTYFAGASVGYRPLPNLGIGFGLTYYNADELVQEFQYAKQSATLSQGEGKPTLPGWSILSSNVRQHLAVYGVQPTLGVQAALPAGFTVGLTVKKTLIASQSLDSTSERNQTSVRADVNTNGPNVTVTPSSNTVNVVTTKSSKPVGTAPAEVRLGFAWFANAKLLLALDAVHTDAVTDADPTLDPNNIRAPYAREAVTNYAVGSEWYVSPSFPLRFGLFTNYDARPKVAQGTSDKATNQTCASLDYYKKYCGQPDHIDYYGGSLFIAWVQPNSQISAGLTLQQGSGKAQKLGDDKVQDVKSQQYSFAFSATHNL